MNILVVEDNGPEQVIMNEAFREAGVKHQLHIVRDGIEAIEFLQGKGAFSQSPKPDLIVLDLNTPRKNGLEVLSDLKNNPKWGHMLVLVFSNSEFSNDICRCYALGANAYLSKPSDFQGFVDLAHVINDFWLKSVKRCPH